MTLLHKEGISQAQVLFLATRRTAVDPGMLTRWMAGHYILYQKPVACSILFFLKKKPYFLILPFCCQNNLGQFVKYRVPYHPFTHPTPILQVSSGAQRRGKS